MEGTRFLKGYGARGLDPRNWQIILTVTSRIRSATPRTSIRLAIATTTIVITTKVLAHTKATRALKNDGAAVAAASISSRDVVARYVAQR